MINSGGIKLHPEQIEKRFQRLSQFRFCIWKPDKRLGQSLSIVFEGHIPNEIETMVLNLDTLSKYEKPKDYFVLSQFVRTNGKILRNQTIQTIDFL